MSSPDERGLALRARQGNRDAFGEIVLRHQQAVFAVAYRLLGDRHDAEDATQEAFIRAFRFFDRFDVERPLGPWLKRIAANVCFNRLEGSKAVQPLEDEQPPTSGSDRSPEVQMMDHERSERLQAELLRLPPRYRLALEFRHFQGLSYAEMATEMKRPVSDVKSDLFRARKLLAERLRDLR